MADSRRPKNPGGEIGITGLEDYSGIIQQEFLRELRISGWGGGYKVYDEMRRNSPVIGGLLNAIKQAILGVDWYFSSDDGEDDPRLELLREAEDNMDFTLAEHMTEALTMLDFGFSVFEVVYERVGGRLLWRKLAFRGQDTVYKWLIDHEKDKGRITGFMQQTNKAYIPVAIPIEKCIHYRTSVERNNPEGLSILRTCYVPYYYAKNIQAVEAIGIERDLTGIPVINLPEGSSGDPDSDDYKRAEAVVKRIRADEQGGVVLGGGYEIRLMSADSSRLIDVGSVISRYEKRMLMSALAQFLALGMDQVGAMSLSEDQTDFFNMSVNSTADMIASAFTRQAVRRLMLLNGIDPNGIKLDHSPAGDTNIEIFTKALQQATGLLTWMPKDEVQLRSVIGLPDATVEEIEEYQEKQRERETSIIAGLPPMNQQQPPMTMPLEDPEDEEGQFSIKTDKETDENRWMKRLSRFFAGQRKRIRDNVAG